MELAVLYKRVIGLDVHQAQITACTLIEEHDGTIRIEQRQFGTYKKDRRALALAQWVVRLQPEEVVMEGTGIYWKSPYTALEATGIRAKVVNARHVKNVPGRKTDISCSVHISDAQWLATLSRAGLLRASFIPHAKMRELRLIARQRQIQVTILYPNYYWWENHLIQTCIFIAVFSIPNMLRKTTSLLLRSRLIQP